jgi:glutathione S-transferase
MTLRDGILDRCLCSTIADLAFITWDMLIPFIFGGEAKDLQLEKNYPNYYAWNQRLIARPAVQKIVKDKQAAMSG